MNEYILSFEDLPMQLINALSSDDFISKALEKINSSSGFDLTRKDVYFEIKHEKFNCFYEISPEDFPREGVIYIKRNKKESISSR